MFSTGVRKYQNAPKIRLSGKYVLYASAQNKDVPRPLRQIPATPHAPSHTRIIHHLVRR